MPYVVTIRETGVYDFHEVSDRRDAVIHHLPITDGTFELFDYRDEVTTAVKRLNKARIERNREMRKSQMKLFEEGI